MSPPRIAVFANVSCSTTYRAINMFPKSGQRCQNSSISHDLLANLLIRTDGIHSLVIHISILILLFGRATEIIVDIHFKMRIISAALLSLASVNAFSPVALRSQYSIQSTALSMSTKLTQDELKKMVGYKAVDDYVKSGMVVGLGTGSTAYFAVERVGDLLKSGELKDIVCIPTSERTMEQALSLDIPLVTLDTHSKLDVAIDGADEVDPDLNLVKGGGGALLREKMVEVMADKFIVIGK